MDGVIRRDGEDVLQLVLAEGDVRARQVDLVDDRNDLHPEVDGKVGVGDRLGLDPLGGIDQQQGPLAGRQAARDLVGEVHVPGRVDEVESVVRAVGRLVLQGDRMALDGDASFPLQVHGIEQLLLHFPLADRLGSLQQTVAERRLPMVNMGDDAEIADSGELAHAN